MPPNKQDYGGAELFVEALIRFTSIMIQVATDNSLLTISPKA